jgi:membrane fusion protein (multidrug efflux system)
MSAEVNEAAPPAANAVPPRRRRRLPVLLAGIAALVAIGWGVQKYLYSRNHVSTDNAQVDGHITPIAPKVSAFVDSVLVDDNSRVKQGDTLVMLDTRELESRLAAAEAELAMAQAAVGGRKQTGQAEAQLQASRATASGASAAVAAAEATFRKAQSDLERYRKLAAQQVISEQQLDAAQAAYESARANLESVKRQAAASSSNVGAAAAGVRAADARLAAAESAVKQAQLQLSYAVITAPVDGIVARRSVEPGELVQVGQSLMAIVPLQDVWITANLKETQLSDVSPGDEAEFSVDAYPGVTFHGKVESLSPATGAKFALLPPDNATGNFTKVVQRVPVRVAIPDQPAIKSHPLRPGMSVEISITTK